MTEQTTEPFSAKASPKTTEEITVPNAETVPTSSLKADGFNPNKMTREQLDRLKTSIKKFGFIVPIITNKDLLIADGEQRWIVANELAMPNVLVIRLPVEDVEEAGLVLADQARRAEQDAVQVRRHAPLPVRERRAVGEAHDAQELVQLDGRVHRQRAAGEPVEGDRLLHDDRREVDAHGRASAAHRQKGNGRTLERLRTRDGQNHRRGRRGDHRWAVVRDGRGA